MKGVQCYELFGGIALKNHAFSFFIFIKDMLEDVVNGCMFGMSTSTKILMTEHVMRTRLYWLHSIT